MRNEIASNTGIINKPFQWNGGTVRGPERGLGPGMDRQFAVLMLRNAKLTVDTMNELTF